MNTVEHEVFVVGLVDRLPEVDAEGFIITG